jgi:hypothetical protein
MQVTSFFDKGKMQVQPLGTIAAAATHADVLFTLGQYQRHTLMLIGAGPNPVGSVTVALKSKAGGAAAVPFPVDTIAYTADAGGAGGPLANHQQVLLGAGGTYVIPASRTAGAADGVFTHAVLLDVPVLPDGTDQLAVAVTNNGTAGTAINAYLIQEHPRY